MDNTSKVEIADGVESKKELTNIVKLSEGVMMTADCSALFMALAQTQLELSNVTKDKQGHGYRYASLANVIDGIREPLAKNGLSVAQFPVFSNESGYCNVTTVITHNSGQLLSSTLTVPVVPNKLNNDIQAYGSAITYARRYALTAILNLAADDEDDDGVKGKDFGQSSILDRAKTVQNVTKEQAKTLVDDSKPHICADCNAEVRANIYSYSVKHYNNVYCIDCQKKHLRRIV